MSFQYPMASAVKVPVSGSIKRQVFEALARGERLTSLDAWARFGTSGKRTTGTEASRRANRHSA